MAIAPVGGVRPTPYASPVTPVAPVQARNGVQTEPVSPISPAHRAAQQVLAQAAGQAATRQGAIAPLFADLGRAVGGNLLPADVREAAQRLLGEGLALSPDLQGDDIASAFQRSGLFLENGLATAPGRSPLGADLKADMLALRAALAAWLGADASPSAARTALAAPPPFRLGPTSAQKPASATLDEEGDPRHAGEILGEELEAAIARHELLQLASTDPDQGKGGSGRRWMFEIPFRRDGEALMAQMEISEEEPGDPAAPLGRSWRARFSLQLAPLGPLHAQISLRGEHLSATIWAEDPASAGVLRLGQPLLAAALREKGLSCDLHVLPGAPAAPASAPAGRFLDHSA